MKRLLNEACVCRCVQVCVCAGVCVQNVSYLAGWVNQACCLTTSYSYSVLKLYQQRKTFAALFRSLTHSLPLSLSVSLCLGLCLCLSLSLSCSHAHTHTHTHYSLSLSVTPSLPPSLSLSLSLYNKQSHTSHRPTPIFPDEPDFGTTHLM